MENKELDALEERHGHAFLSIISYVDQQTRINDRNVLNIHNHIKAVDQNVSTLYKNLETLAKSVELLQKLELERARERETPSPCCTIS